MNTDNKDVRDQAGETADDMAHSAAADKAKGHGKEVTGKVKEKVGELVGNRELELKGRTQRADGKIDRLKGEIKEKVEDAKDYVKAGAEVVKDKIDKERGRR